MIDRQLKDTCEASFAPHIPHIMEILLTWMLTARKTSLQYVVSISEMVKIFVPDILYTTETTGRKERQCSFLHSRAMSV